MVEDTVQIVIIGESGSDLCSNWEIQENYPKRSGLFALKPAFLTGAQYP